jgi:hypothetical protein
MKSMIPVTMIPVNEKLNANPEQPASQPTPDQQESQSLPRAPFPRHLSQRLTVERLVEHAGHITKVHNNLAAQVDQHKTRTSVQFSAHADGLRRHSDGLKMHEGRLELHAHSLSAIEARIPCGHGLWARLRWLATGK